MCCAYTGVSYFLGFQLSDWNIARVGIKYRLHRMELSFGRKRRDHAASLVKRIIAYVVCICAYINTAFALAFIYGGAEHMASAIARVCT